jgi:hypothetical protein
MQYYLLPKKSVINMGIKIHNNLPFKLKRIGNFKVFKNKLKTYYYKTVFILCKSFLVTMIDGSLVTRVSLDMIQKYIDGIWSVIFSKCVMLCFTWLTCVFWLFKYIALY